MSQLDDQIKSLGLENLLVKKLDLLLANPAPSLPLENSAETKSVSTIDMSSELQRLLAEIPLSDKY